MEIYNGRLFRARHVNHDRYIIIETVFLELNEEAQSLVQQHMGMHLTYLPLHYDHNFSEETHDPPSERPRYLRVEKFYLKYGCIFVLHAEPFNPVATLRVWNLGYNDIEPKFMYSLKLPSAKLLMFSNENMIQARKRGDVDEVAVYDFRTGKKRFVHTCMHKLLYNNANVFYLNYMVLVCDDAVYFLDIETGEVPKKFYFNQRQFSREIEFISVKVAVYKDTLYLLSSHKIATVDLKSETVRLFTVPRPCEYNTEFFVYKGVVYRVNQGQSKGDVEICRVDLNLQTKTAEHYLLFNNLGKFVRVECTSHVSYSRFYKNHLLVYMELETEGDKEGWCLAAICFEPGKHSVRILAEFTLDFYRDWLGDNFYEIESTTRYVERKHGKRMKLSLPNEDTFLFDQISENPNISLDELYDAFVEGYDTAPSNLDMYKFYTEIKQRVARDFVSTVEYMYKCAAFVTTHEHHTHIIRDVEVLRVLYKRKLVQRLLPDAMHHTEGGTLVSSLIAKYI